MSSRALPLLAVGALACGQESPRVERPDVLFVVVDTLRADHLSFLGYEKETAPFLASLADESIVFERAWSASSWTAPAVASIFTGLLPSQHGVLTGFNAYGARGETVTAVELNRIPGGLLTLPRAMQALGYRTFGIADNANLRTGSGFERGFDSFTGYDYRSAGAVNGRLRELAEEIRGGDAPWFVYLHYMDPHGPYHKRAPWYDFDEAPLEIDASLAPDRVHEVTDDPWIRRFEVRQLLHRAQTAATPEESQVWLDRIRAYLEAVYDSEIRYLDEHLREAFAMLGADESTLVVFVADHGEELGDRGRVGHEFRMYSELLHVPLLVRPHAAAGLAPRRIRRDVGTVDLLATLHDLLDVPAPDHLAGTSLLADDASSEPVFSMRTREIPGLPTEHQEAVIDGPDKLILHRPEGRVELYDLRADPGERTNVAPDAPADVARLRALLDTLDELPRWEREFVPLHLDDAARERIEELGYGGE